MVILKLLLTLVGILTASCSGAVLKPYFNSPSFEIYTAPNKAPLFRSGIPSFLATPILPIPIQYGKADCEHDNLFETNLVADFDKKSKNDLIYEYNPQVSIIPFVPELQIKTSARENIIVVATEENAPCDEVYEEPKKSEPIRIPDAPMLPSFSLPEMPTVEKSDADCDSLTHPGMSKIEYKINNRILIPEAPILSPLLLPDLPIKNKEDWTSRDDIKMLQEDGKIRDFPVIIPEAPVLPAFSMPELPTRARLEELPVIKESALPIEQNIPVTISEAPKLALSTFDGEPKPCDEVTFVQEQPKINDVQITVPEAPILPAFSMPELPRRRILEELPVIKEPTQSIEQNTSVMIPEAPKLALLNAPKLSTNFNEESQPCDDVSLVQEEPKVNDVPITIPEAPILPAFSMPELPTRAIVEELPENMEPALPTVEQNIPVMTPETLKRVLLTESSVSHEVPETCDEDTFSQEVPKLQNVPITIPEAPTLPAFSMPELPTKSPFEELPEIKEPTLPIEPKVKAIIPIIIPETPQLAPMSVQEPPMIVQRQSQSCDETEFTKENLKIPEAPILPAFSMPKLPTRVSEDLPEVKTPINLPEISLPYLPVVPKFEPCIDSETKLLVNEHINLPKVLPPTLRPPTLRASSPIIVQAPMQIVVHGSDMGRLDGAEDCLYNYLTNRIIKSTV